MNFQCMSYFEMQEVQWTEVKLVTYSGEIVLFRYSDNCAVEQKTASVSISDSTTGQSVCSPHTGQHTHLRHMPSPYKAFHNK